MAFLFSVRFLFLFVFFLLFAMVRVFRWTLILTVFVMLVFFVMIFMAPFFTISKLLFHSIFKKFAFMNVSMITVSMAMMISSFLVILMIVSASMIFFLAMISPILIVILWKILLEMLRSLNKILHVLKVLHLQLHLKILKTVLIIDYELSVYRSIKGIIKHNLLMIFAKLIYFLLESLEKNVWIAMIVIGDTGYKRLYSQVAIFSWILLDDWLNELYSEPL